jgi:hypothetical protein
MRTSRLFLSAGLALLVCVTPDRLLAQTYTATMTGTVVDPAGAAVPKVKVVAVNEGTKLEYRAETSDAGVYRISFLPIGSYVVSAEASGFKKILSNPIQLEVNQVARVDLTLELGSARRRRSCKPKRPPSDRSSRGTPRSVCR